MDIQNEIIKTIELMVDKAIGDKTSTDWNGVVTGITDKGTYLVSCNGMSMETYDAVGCEPKVGSSVWIHNPVGNTINSAYIMGLRGKSATGNSSEGTSSTATYGLGSTTKNGKHYIILTKNGTTVSQVEDLSGSQVEYATKNDVLALFAERGLS